MKDDLGTRMKDYEFRARSYLPRRTNVVLRLDGKAFHTYTRGLAKPFDYQLIEDMGKVTAYLCANIQNAKLGYTQSDEISLLLADYGSIKTDSWFDNAIQKMVSIAASMATAKFNELRPGKLAFFDARVFAIPEKAEVANYFLWRQQDATRNSIAMAAQSKFSHKQLHKVSANAMQELLWREGINWNDYPATAKRGSVVFKQDYLTDQEYVNKKTGNTEVAKGVQRSRWVIEGAPIFNRTELLPALLESL